jgi:hypothetical protein
VAPLLEPRLALLGVEFKNRDADGIALHNNRDLYEQLKECLSSTRPLASCSYCLGSYGPLTPRRQLNRVGRTAWISEDNKAQINEASLANTISDAPES